MAEVFLPLTRGFSLLFLNAPNIWDGALAYGITHPTKLVVCQAKFAELNNEPQRQGSALGGFPDLKQLPRREHRGRGREKYSQTLFTLQC
ncbi:hypothetical protein [Nostoc sp.]|uniref:hypothetical protein n=1 Tax=Nostoc sp. TaxID=1180 RepID=UPI002FFA8EF9